MRTKKALINSSVNIMSYILIFIPNLIIRKIFLEGLGNELLGLNSLYNNIIGWLSIIELGVGTAIIYSLYEPFAKGDKNKVGLYIKFYGRFYRRIGLIILAIGLIISPFIDIFIAENIDNKLASIGFIIFLFNSFLSYMFSHKLSIINVSQEGYKITIGLTISKLLIILFQSILIKVYPSFILFLCIQLIVNFIYFISINIYINKKYSWINKIQGEINAKEKKSLIKNMKALFMHKIGSLVVNSTDNIVISKFVGLISVANYTNYQVVISAVQSVIGSGLNGLTASIGNMLSNRKKEYAYDIHKKIFFINFWAVSFLVISLYNTLNQFITIWVGKKYLLDNVTFNIILINLYFSAMRGSVEQFQSGSGNFYQDRYAPICEASINLICSLILVKYIGISGVFIGTLISNFTVIFWTKPFVVYKYVFNVPLKEYFKMYFKYLIIGFIPLIISIISTISIKDSQNIGMFILNCCINIVVINCCYLIIFWNSKEFLYFRNLFLNNIIKKFK